MQVSVTALLSCVISSKFSTLLQGLVTVSMAATLWSSALGGTGYWRLSCHRVTYDLTTQERRER